MEKLLKQMGIQKKSMRSKIIKTPITKSSPIRSIYNNNTILYKKDKKYVRILIVIEKRQLTTGCP